MDLNLNFIHEFIIDKANVNNSLETKNSDNTK